MRLWHYKLIPVLPNKHLCGQYREIAAIVSMYDAGTINHSTINRVKDYSRKELMTYAKIVTDEMNRRNFTTKSTILNAADVNFYKVIYQGTDVLVDGNLIFANFHNLRYLVQNYYQFQEAFDTGVVKEEDFIKIKKLCEKETKKSLY